MVCVTPGNFMTKLGLPVIPVSETLYSWWNILITLALAVGMMVLYKVMKPPADEPIREFIAPPEEVEVKKKSKTWCLQKSWIILMLSTLFLQQ